MEHDASDDINTWAVSVALLLIILGMLYLSYSLDVLVVRKPVAAPPPPRGWQWRPLGAFSPF